MIHQFVLCPQDKRDAGHAEREAEDDEHNADQHRGRSFEDPCRVRRAAPLVAVAHDDRVPARRERAEREEEQAGPDELRPREPIGGDQHEQPGDADNGEDDERPSGSGHDEKIGSARAEVEPYPRR